MSQHEMFDVFDEEMRKTGQASRKDVHAQGLWHQTFHCWIVNKSAEGGASLLLQLRHKDKDTFPNLFDISCAGHLLSGETVRDGVRELEEELGLRASFEELHYCGMVAQENIVTARLIDREFNHIFVYECDKPVEAYEFQLSEISGLFAVDAEAYKQLVTGERDSITAEGILMDDHGRERLQVSREIRVGDIVPNTDAYYRLLFDRIG
ncbi:NUDIX hydrolase [Paenibacillus sp. MBLB4367]|uniref:NUDIX hydrolase n=1 Tax=Paenibacillus sp. MBLB4367 TaxID=3384767 RepID=UPI0039081F80